MARKPTRFWHPAKRLLVQAQETTRSLISQRDDQAKLDDVRPRLQHYLRAMYGDGMTIESLTPPKHTNLAMRALQNVALAKQLATSESTAQYIRLPESLPAQASNASALEQYRVMAVQHAERIQRASATHAREVTTDLERDLYDLAEAATIDAQIAESQPGLAPALDAARLESIAQRSTPRFRTAIELRVEEMIRSTWAATTTDRASNRNVSNNIVDSETTGSAIPRTNNAESNATWARRMAVELEGKFGRTAAQSYRRVPEITLWQTTIRTQLPEDQPLALETERRHGEDNASKPEWDAPAKSAIPGGAQSRSESRNAGNTPDKSDNGNPSSRKESGGAADGGDDDDRDATDEQKQNTNAKRKPKANKNIKSNRATDRNKQQQTREQNTDDHDAESVDSDSGARGDATGVTHSEHNIDDAMLAEGVTYRYPEWDFNAHNFTATGTVVRVTPPPLGPSEWATSALQQHAREIHQSKRQFERLRSQRLRLRRQVQGDELDLEACVESMVDRQMNIAPTDRLYSHVRPGRRDLAITLLIDVSGSTSEIVAGEQRVIDIERIAALVAIAAFDALGDDYSVLAFSSSGASNVRVHTLKEFGEVNSTLVLQRISALEPHGTTRLGAAVRHATATLSNHPAPHRLLLMLSDGKPHDYDGYFVDYAVQDSRQAVMNARLHGIHPFCITVDAADGESYLPEVFGVAGYRVVSRPSQLSQALLQAVQRMIGGSS